MLAVTSLAVMRCKPWVKKPDAKLHTPVVALLVAVPSKMVPSYTSTLPPLVTATPVRVGQASRVRASPSSPLSLAVARVGKPITAVLMVKA